MPHDLLDVVMVGAAWLSLLGFAVALCYAAAKPSPPLEKSLEDVRDGRAT